MPCSNSGVPRWPAPGNRGRPYRADQKPALSQGIAEAEGKIRFARQQGLKPVEIAYEHRFEQYDLHMRRPDPLVPRNLRIGIPERLAADGEVLKPLDEEAVAAAALRLRGDGVESLAIGFLHSYRHAHHETAAADVVRSVWPEVPLTLSSDVCPEIREYERFSTACANAYVQPLMGRYLLDLEARRRESGMRCPMFLMQSGGGIIAAPAARAAPVRLAESGPVLPQNLPPGPLQASTITSSGSGATSKSISWLASSWMV